jgi:hypothetical protein
MSVVRSQFVRSREVRVVLAAVVLFTVGLMVWPGCALLPLPSKRTPIASRTTEPFKIRQPQRFTRPEVVARLGPPDQYYEDIRVACYRVNDVEKRKLFLLLFVIPVNVWKEKAYDIGLVEFDEQDRVRRATVKTYPVHRTLQVVAQEWVSEGKR